MQASLREWRTRRLFSVDDLAERSGVSNKTIVQIEHGRQLPRFRTMQRLSTALGVEADQVAEFVEAIEEAGKAVAAQAEAA